MNGKKDHKIFGVNGLVLGAAIGTGFGAMESVYYALGSTLMASSITYGFETVFLRLIFAFAGHTMFCAPYLAAVALHSRNGITPPYKPKTYQNGRVYPFYNLYDSFCSPITLPQFKGSFSVFLPDFPLIMCLHKVILTFFMSLVKALFIRKNALKSRLLALKNPHFTRFSGTFRMRTTISSIRLIIVDIKIIIFCPIIFL